MVNENVDTKPSPPPIDENEAAITAGMLKIINQNLFQKNNFDNKMNYSITKFLWKQLIWKPMLRLL